MAKATKGPVGGATTRTYKAEGGNLLRGTAVIAGTAEDQVKAPAAANDPAIGVLGENIDQDKIGPMVMSGETIAIAGGVVADGDWVKVGGVDGRLITIGGEAAVSVLNIIGRARSNAAADGDEFVLDVGPYQDTRDAV